MRDKFDVVIVGGAAVGSAAAYFLAQDPGFGGTVLVLERDPSYTQCATTRSAASVRHQFSTPQNIRMSMFGTEFLRRANELLAVDGHAPGVHLNEGGYLFLASADGVPVLQANHQAQRAEGAQVALLSPEETAQRFPWLQCNDLAAASLGLAGEGWFDAHVLLQAYRRKAISLGVSYRHAEAVALRCEGHKVNAVILADGSIIECGSVINAAGTGAAALARSAGIELPVQSRKRCVFHFSSPEKAPACPLIIDPTGLWFRPEGTGFICGIAPPESEDPECVDFDVPLQWWDELLWPALAQRVPGFEAARLLSAWAGHYDVNTLDHNVILGAHPEVDNLLFANGFSGHGLQQSPAVGRALSELVSTGRYRTLDLKAFGWQRIIDKHPLRELNVV